MMVLILGASGFVGRNLTCYLSNQPDFEVHGYSRELSEIQDDATYDVIINCVGVSRSDSSADFSIGNVSFLSWFFNEHLSSKKVKFRRVIHLSSSKAGDDTIYGLTKAEGEVLIKKICRSFGSTLKILRYPNLFGKWSKPDYNSVVATWCRDLRFSMKPKINGGTNLIELTYIDDVCREIFNLCLSSEQEFISQNSLDLSTAPVFSISLQKLYQTLTEISSSVSKVGLFSPNNEFEKNLFSTYISFLDPRDTLFNLQGHGDKRGEFYEVFKLGINGQISVSSTNPDKEPRGNHFHMSKVEVFCLLSGRAKMRHKKWGTNKVLENDLDAFQCITTIPGYIHDIQNVTDEPLLLLIWANEVFEKRNPDTFQATL